MTEVNVVLTKGCDSVSITIILRKQKLFSRKEVRTNMLFLIVCTQNITSYITIKKQNTFTAVEETPKEK